VVSTSSTTADGLAFQIEFAGNRPWRTFEALSFHGSDACGALSRLRGSRSP